MATARHKTDDSNSEDDLLSVVTDLHEQIAAHPSRQVWSLDLTRLDALAGIGPAESTDEAEADAG